MKPGSAGERARSVKYSHGSVEFRSRRIAACKTLTTSTGRHEVVRAGGGWASGSVGVIWREGVRWLPGEAVLYYTSTVLSKGSVRVRRYKWGNSLETESLTRENPVPEGYLSS